MGAVALTRMGQVRVGAGSAVAVVVVIALALIAVGRQSSAPAPASGHGWSSIPLAARGPVSATLGRMTASYRVGKDLVAINPDQRLRAVFGRHGVRVHTAGTLLGLRLASVGRGRSLMPVRPVSPRADGNRVSFARSGLTEWYANGPQGLEQGFTLARRPVAGRAPLTLSLQLSGNARPVLIAGGRAMQFERRGHVFLVYRDLSVTDALGRPLHALLSLQRHRLLIHVDDRRAAYPLRIDPLVQQAKLSASDGAAGDRFGNSIAVSGDGSTVVVGAYNATVGANGNKGAA